MTLTRKTRLLVVSIKRQRHNVVATHEAMLQLGKVVSEILQVVKQRLIPSHTQYYHWRWANMYLRWQNKLAWASTQKNWRAGKANNLGVLMVKSSKSNKFLSVAIILLVQYRTWCYCKRKHSLIQFFFQTPLEMIRPGGTFYQYLIKIRDSIKTETKNKSFPSLTGNKAS